MNRSLEGPGHVARIAVAAILASCSSSKDGKPADGSGADGDDAAAEASLDEFGRCYAPSPPTADGLCPADRAETSGSAALTAYCGLDPNRRGAPGGEAMCDGVVAFRGVTYPLSGAYLADVTTCYYDAPSGRLIAREVCTDTLGFCGRRASCSVTGTAVPRCPIPRPTEADCVAAGATGGAGARTGLGSGGADGAGGRGTPVAP